MARQKEVNGVNVDQLFETIDQIKRDPSVAACRFRARNEWVEGTHCRATVKEFHAAGREDESRSEAGVFEIDEPPVLLGANRGYNPVEYVLVALSGCLTTSLVLQAAAKGIRLDSVESRLEGDLDVRGLLGLDEKVRNGYREIRVVFKVKGDAPPDQLRELVRLAQERSPVFDIVTNRVPVSVELEGA